jgi:hypothetical protein
LDHLDTFPVCMVIPSLGILTVTLTDALLPQM